MTRSLGVAVASAGFVVGCVDSAVVVFVAALGISAGTPRFIAGFDSYF